ncbi:MAG: hypothetical protein AAFQ10_03455 [Pseudomonadota bacterium]
MARDHCTLWWDRLFGKDWSQCCAAHDQAYALGVDRGLADAALEACVAVVTGWPLWAAIMGAGVTVFGGFFYKRRWGLASDH